MFTPVLLQAESPEPTGVPPQVGPIILVADSKSGDVGLEWGGGTPPFAIVRANHQCFRDADHVWALGTNIRSHKFVDAGALRLGEQMYYQVYDANSMPEAHWLSPDGGLPGKEITIRGAGFDQDCSKNSVYIAGAPARVVECSFIHLVFVAPENSITGSVTVSTPSGAALLGDCCNEFSRQPVTWTSDGR